MDSTEKRCIFWAPFAYLGTKNPFWGHRESLKNIPKSQLWKSTFSDYNVIKLKVIKEMSIKEFNTKKKAFINNTQIREKIKIYL